MHFTSPAAAAANAIEKYLPLKCFCYRNRNVEKYIRFLNIKQQHQQIYIDIRISFEDAFLFTKNMHRDAYVLHWALNNLFFRFFFMFFFYTDFVFYSCSYIQTTSYDMLRCATLKDTLYFCGVCMCVCV